MTGLEPNAELLTIEFRRRDVVFYTLSSQDLEATTGISGTFDAEIQLESELVGLPPGNWEFVAEVTQPESCDATATSTR